MWEKKCKLDKWNEEKYRIDAAAGIPVVKEGTIWWCSMGENVGVEINGKSERFTRPVLIYKKLSRQCLWVIPLSTQVKTGSWYVAFDFHSRRQVAVLSQIRAISAERLRQKMGTLDDHDFSAIKAAMRQLIP